MMRRVLLMLVLSLVGCGYTPPPSSLKTSEMVLEKDTIFIRYTAAWLQDDLPSFHDTHVEGRQLQWSETVKTRYNLSYPPTRYVLYRALKGTRVLVYESPPFNAEKYKIESVDKSLFSSKPYPRCRIPVEGPGPVNEPQQPSSEPLIDCLE